MREIKFRAWLPARKMFGYVNVVGLGSFTFSPQGVNNFGELYDYSLSSVDVAPSPLMKFTGLKDKNGVEIYEGDIDRNGYVMTYDWACFRFRKGQHTKPYTQYRYGDVVNKDTLDVEVVGNIYENPELLGTA